MIFLPIAFFCYWFVFNGQLRWRNFFLATISYIFYGWWDWRFLSLIFLSTLVDYVVGLQLAKSDDRRNRKAWLILSMVFNLGLLGFFKYYNFFVASWIEAFAGIGYDMSNSWTIKVILPVGISFYTFQTMSYSLDIYQKKLKPTRDFISFAAFVSFFPQLVAGPIERASNLLPQILQKHKFQYQQGIEGLRLIVWGLFKKIVIADNLAPVVNDIFANYTDYSGGTLILGAVYFAFQIYGDFSGYSDIAIGISKLFGFELMSNFKFPYFSRNIGEFWRRWHISLSTWFRDYLYIPLGGSRGSQLMAIKNIFIIFLVSGFWHGANWTFLAWGGIHALLFVPLFIFGVNRKNVDNVVAESKMLPNFREIAMLSITFVLVTIAWIFFRAESVSHAISYISHISLSNPVYKLQIVYPIMLLLLEWPMRKNERLPWPQVKSFPFILIVSIAIMLLRYQDEGNVEFIYFQF